MADFVEVLRKTLDGLNNPPAETRQRVYERARATVVSRLDGMNPPTSAPVREMQLRALDDAVRSVEQSYAPRKPIDPIDELENVFRSLNGLMNQPTTPAPAKFPVYRSLHGETKYGTHAVPAQRSFYRNVADFRPPLMPSSSRSSEPQVPIVLRDVLVDQKAPARKPKEPKLREGPKFEYRDGKIRAARGHVALKREIALQAGLHRELRATISALTASLETVRNRFPELARTVETYAAIIEPDTPELDLDRVWSVGSALHGFEANYRQQNLEQTLSAPLEPHIAAMVQTTVRVHGAFILGFKRGRELVERADRFLEEPAVAASVAAPGSELLDALASNRNILSDQAIQDAAPVRDYVTEFGWSTSRAGFAAYVTAKNLVYAILHQIAGQKPTVTALLGGAVTYSVVAGDNNLEFLRAAIPVVKLHSTSILAFVNHSPELRAYAEWVLTLLDQDHRTRK